MSTTTDTAFYLAPQDAGADLTPAGPFYAVRYHFGMLLGVDDFETEQAYHRGKMRLHESWLHRDGVVWGFGVDAPGVPGRAGTLDGEIRVQPGLALDAAGRELHLDQPACVTVGAWYDKHKDDSGFAPDTSGGQVRFDAHVVARFKVCLTRQVPAMAAPCAGDEADTAYSRALETVELLLLPGLAPADPPLPYHRLRLLFGIDADPATPSADEQAVIDERERIRGLQPEDRPPAWLAALRRFGVADELELHPGTKTDGTGSTLFPAEDDCVVLLANVAGIVLQRDADDQPWRMTAASVDQTVRRILLPTATIQELLCGPPEGDAATSGTGGSVSGDGGTTGTGGTSGSGGGAGAGGPSGADAATSPAPRIDRASLDLRGETLRMTVSTSLSAASVAPECFSVSTYQTTDGWHDVEVTAARWDRSRKRITLDLATAPEGVLVRLIARGTGPSPLIGTEPGYMPLAGATDTPDATPHDGRDFVHMWNRSERRS